MAALAGMALASAGLAAVSLTRAPVPLFYVCLFLSGTARALLGPAKSAVTLYTTSWCPACKRAKAWLKGKQVAYVERDVESDSAARSELAAEAEKQGVGKRGVPVLDAYGKLAEGFSEQTYAKLLKLEE